MRPGRAIGAIVGIVLALSYYIGKPFDLLTIAGIIIVIAICAAIGEGIGAGESR